MSVTIAIKDGGDLDINAPGSRLLVIPALLIYSLVICRFFRLNFLFKLIFNYGLGKKEGGIITISFSLATFSSLIYVAYGVDHALEDHLCTHEH